MFVWHQPTLKFASGFLARFARAVAQRLQWPQRSTSVDGTALCAEKHVLVAVQHSALVTDVYDPRKFHIGARCLAPQNSLCGCMTDFRLCHKFTFRFTLNSVERLGLASARLTVPFPSADVRSP